jgi:hypothetical protein
MFVAQGATKPNGRAHRCPTANAVNEPDAPAHPP